MLKHRRNSDVINELLTLSGKRILDVGCGTGGLTRFMSRNGAQVTGIECNSRQLDKARSASPVSSEHYIEGVGEALPISGEKVDIVIYFNSLHHVAASQQGQALKDAARVLVPNGQLYICEPIAEGPHFDLMKPIDDETHVRDQAYAAIQRAKKNLFHETSETIYLHTVKQKNFEQFEEEMTRVSPDRKSLFEAKRDEMQSAYSRFGTMQEDGRMAFEQPMRVNLLTKQDAPA